VPKNDLEEHFASAIRNAEDVIDDDSFIDLRSHPTRDTCRLLQRIRDGFASYLSISQQTDCDTETQDARPLLVDCATAVDNAMDELLSYWQPRFFAEQRIAQQTIDEKAKRDAALEEARLLGKVIVVPEFVTDVRREYDVSKEIRELAGKPIDCQHASPREIETMVAKLSSSWPWALDLLAGMIRPLQNRIRAGQTRVRLPPTLIVGPPGCGKTAFAEAVLKILRLSPLSIGLQSDPKQLASASAYWGNAAPHPFLLHIARSHIANPGIVLNELDKIPESRHHGSAADDLLMLLEPGEAAKIYDGKLRVNIDLSHINYIATANSVRTVPTPLLSRFTVREMPRPESQHIDKIIAYQRKQIALDWGCSVTDVPVIDDVERRSLMLALDNGSSLRALSRMIENLVGEASKSRPINWH
jgi:hypothetical protein